MFTKKNRIPFDSPVTCNEANYYNPSLFDEFLYIDGIRYSDITYLFHQDRLDKRISTFDLENYVSALRDRLPENVFAGMSNDVICDLIQSRRITNFADLRSQALYNSYCAEQIREEQQREKSAKEANEKRRADIEKLINDSRSKTPDKD